MGYFLAKTWMWWLLSAVLAALLTWLWLRWLERRSGDDAGGAAAASDAGAAGNGTRAVLTPARGLSLRGVLGGGEGEVAALRAEVDSLRAKADEVEDLRSAVVTLKVDAARATGLEEEVRLLRMRLEGEDGQVAVLKRRIALLEAEASRVPDLERELARAGRPTTMRTLGQVVQQAAGLEEDAPPAAPTSPAVGVTVVERDAPAPAPPAAPAPVPAAVSAAVPAAVSAPASAPAAVPPSTVGSAPAAATVTESAPAAVALADDPAPDLHAARVILGTAVRMDDLKIVEGVGPKIESLLLEAGIRTWRDLAGSTADRLREVLDAAGPRFQMHDPASWPEQAELLARGRWKEFVALTDRLKGGRA